MTGRPNMKFWSVDLLQIFTFWFQKKGQAERESVRVHRWCKIKDDAVDAMLAALARGAPSR